MPLDLSADKPVNDVTSNADAISDAFTKIEANVNALPIAQLAGYPSDATKVLQGDGTWAVNAATSLLTKGQGGDITAASTINVDHVVHRVSGATQIQQITANGVTPIGGMVVTLISVGGAIVYNSNANIFATAAGSTRTVPQHAAVTLVYDGTLGQWNVAGVGS